MFSQIDDESLSEHSMENELSLIKIRKWNEKNLLKTEIFE